LNRSHFKTPTLPPSQLFCYRSCHVELEFWGFIFNRSAALVSGQLPRPHSEIQTLGNMKYLILVLTFVAACSFAQPTEPVWLNQIKLSGLSGSASNRLAVISGKTFSAGEVADLKLKGRTVQVQCLEIREQSALVQIQDLPSRYELTISGDVIAVDNISAETAPSPSVARVETPPSAPQILPLILGRATNQSHNGSNIFPTGIIWFFAGIILALMFGIALGAGAAQIRHRKNLGEAMLADTIDRHFSRPHLLLNNITLPTADGTTQIDHVLVADTGIFVIETKHYSGWIFGDPKERQWTQSIYRKKSRFQNPLHQNYGHIKALQSLFDLPAEHFQSVVVFTSDAVFKTDLGPNVVRLGGLIPLLTAERPTLYDERKMTYIIGRIEMKRERRSVETDEYHINHLRNRLAGQSSKRGPQTVFPPPASNPFTAASGDEKYQPKA
jgi:restriction system protein